MKLDGKLVLVTGAGGQVGWGVAHAARAAGARLVLPTRSEHTRANLAVEFPEASVIVADVGLERDSEMLADHLADLGGIDHVFAPIGSWWQGGPTIDQPTSQLAELLTTYVSAQHRLLSTARSFLNESKGSYTAVTGAAGESIIPDAGMLVIAVRAQYALCDILRNELAAAPFRFNELRITGRIERESRPGVITSRTAGEAFVELITSDVRASLVRYPA